MANEYKWGPEIIDDLTLSQWAYYCFKPDDEDKQRNGFNSDSIAAGIQAARARAKEYTNRIAERIIAYSNGKLKEHDEERKAARKLMAKPRPSSRITSKTEKITLAEWRERASEGMKPKKQPK